MAASRQQFLPGYEVENPTVHLLNMEACKAVTETKHANRKPTSHGTMQKTNRSGQEFSENQFEKSRNSYCSITLEGDVLGAQNPLQKLLLRLD